MTKILALTIESIQEVMKQKGIKEPKLHQDMDLLQDTPLDSLDLAQVVIVLEEKTGKDPFSHGFIPFRTILDLARLYE